MTKTTKTILGVVMVIIAAFLVWYGVSKKPQAPVSKESIKIGILTPLTGSTAEYGNDVKNGIELATEEINSKGGINGKQIELFYQDSKCDPKEAISGFNTLVDSKGVKIILGTVCSSETLAIAPLANEKKILVISAAASSPEITNAGDFIFRLYPSDNYEGNVVAEIIAKQLKKTKVSVLYINNDYGAALKNTFKNKFTQLGGEVLNEEGYLQDAKDFRTQLTKIKAKNPEVVYMISYPIDGGLAIKQAKELGINALFIGSSGLKANDFIHNGGSATEDFIVVAPAKSSSSTKDIFINNFENKFGKKPGFIADIGYDSVYILKQAFINSKNIDDVKNNLYKIKGFNGASGMISFDSNGDLIDVKYDVLTIKNGQFVPYEE